MFLVYQIEAFLNRLYIKNELMNWRKFFRVAINSENIKFH